jgi:hypothetical protein
VVLVWMRIVLRWLRRLVGGLVCVGVIGMSESGISRFLSCPECESDDVSWRVNNGRLVLSCEDCLETTSKLVGRATFR